MFAFTILLLCSLDYVSSSIESDLMSLQRDIQDFERADPGVYCAFSPFTSPDDGKFVVKEAISDADDIKDWVDDKDVVHKKIDGDHCNDHVYSQESKDKLFECINKNGKWKTQYVGPMNFEAKSPPCCTGSNPSPHKKDENGNFIDFVHLEDAWAYGVFKAASAAADCPVQKLVDAIVSKDNVVCTGEGKKPFCEEGKDAKKFNKTVDFFKAKRKEGPATEKDCEQYFKDLVEGSPVTPPFLYEHFDRTMSKYQHIDADRSVSCTPESSYACKVAAWQLDLTSKQMFKNNAVDVVDQSGKTMAHEDNNGINKGRAATCAPWYHATVSGNGGRDVRPERAGGLSSDLLSCKLTKADMGFPEKYVGGKNRGCRGQAFQAKIYRSCGAPFTMGISGTIVHTLRVAASGFGGKLQEGQIIAGVAAMIIGGHHTLTEAGLSAAHFSKFQKEFGPASDLEKDSETLTNNPIALNSYKGDPPSNETEALANYDASAYLAYVKAMYAFAEKTFPGFSEFAEEAMPKDPEGSYSSTWELIANWKELIADCGATLYESVSKVIPFDPNGEAKDLDGVKLDNTACVDLLKDAPEDDIQPGLSLEGQRDEEPSNYGFGL